MSKTEFLPFHAINEFMRPDFRLSVIRETLLSQSSLPDKLSNDLNHEIKKSVSIPGFRHSDRAPALVKVLPTVKAFEKSPNLVAALLSCWVVNQSNLCDQVYQLLSSRNWNLLSNAEELAAETLSLDLLNNWPVFPLSFDRSRLPGFYIHWPKGEDFETLYSEYCELFPDSEASVDKVSLMVVWLSMRLPYHVEENEPV